MHVPIFLCETGRKLKQNVEPRPSNVNAKTLRWVATIVKKRVSELTTESGGNFEH
jgi:hypothetical protein